MFWLFALCGFCLFFFSSGRRHTRCALVTGVQTCALPICPVVIVDIRARADADDRPAFRTALDEGRVAAMLVGGVLGGHVAAAAPGFVADAEIFEVGPRLVAAVGATFLRERRLAVGGQIGRAHV